MGRALASTWNAVEATGRGFVEIARDAWAARAVTLHALAIVLGWALLTAGVARLLVPEVWLISGGLFLLSLSGWSHLRTLFGAGLYALHRVRQVRR